MYIQNRTLVVFYRLLVTVLSVTGCWLISLQIGDSMIRLFSVWFLILSVVYFAISTIVTAFFRKRSPGKVICPMLQGAVIISGIISMVGQIFLFAMDDAAPITNGWLVLLVDFILPVLVFLDWSLFTKKGSWRTSEPFYWLALPTIYVCWILITANWAHNDIPLLYPYSFLNWPEYGIDTMLWQLAIAGVLIVVFGYVCFLMDFALSGKLAKHIVLPRIKTIVVEEDIEEDDSATEASATSETDSKASPSKGPKSAKTTASRSVPSTKPARKQPATNRPIKVESLKDEKSAQSMHAKHSASRAKTNARPSSDASIESVEKPAPIPVKHATKPSPKPKEAQVSKSAKANSSQPGKKTPSSQPTTNIRIIEMVDIPEKTESKAKSEPEEIKSTSKKSNSNDKTGRNSKKPNPDPASDKKSDSSAK